MHLGKSFLVFPCQIKRSLDSIHPFRDLSSKLENVDGKRLALCYFGVFDSSGDTIQ